MDFIVKDVTTRCKGRSTPLETLPLWVGWSERGRGDCNKLHDQNAKNLIDRTTHVIYKWFKVYRINPKSNETYID